MAKDDHWFKLYYRLLVLSTQGWKDDEFGAYVRLLIHQFDKGGLPDDPGEISKLITTYKKNWPLLSKKFNKTEDGLLRNEFMKSLREERDKKKTIGAEFGKTGGRGNKKGTLFEIKANPLENEKVNISSSFSPSPSVGDQGGMGEQEEVELSPGGFFSDALDKSLILTDVEIGATVQYIKLTAKKILENREVVDRWEAFKIRQFSLHEWYNNWERLLSHFRDSLKLEFKNAGNNSKNHTHQPVITGTATGAGSF